MLLIFKFKAVGMWKRKRQNGKIYFIVFISFLLPAFGFSEVRTGSWSFSGEVIDRRTIDMGMSMYGTGPQVTNTLSLTGYCSDGNFMVDLVPKRTEDDIAESAGWNGSDLFLIQRWPKVKGQARNQSLGYIEPSVFSRYATPALDPVLIAFADSNALSNLESGKYVVILNTFRKYPEENDTFSVKSSPGSVNITALSPGKTVERNGSLTPISGFVDGFTRWTFSAYREDNTMQVEYKRFDIYQGKLIQTRDVTGNFLFTKGGANVASFQPEITEGSLTVMDYSQRQKLAQFYKKKGLMDQNRTYILTNHLWNFGFYSNNTAKDFNFREDHFAAIGVPSSLVSAPVNAAPLESKKHRLVILCALIGVSVIFAVIICFRLVETNKQ